MKKVADDITASSLFSPGYPTEGSITASFPMPFAKDSFQTGTRMQKLQNSPFQRINRLCASIFQAAAPDRQYVFVLGLIRTLRRFLACLIGFVNRVQRLAHSFIVPLRQKTKIFQNIRIIPTP